MNLKNLNVIFAGCARDCSEFLPKTLNNIKHYSSLFRQSYSIVIENGSSDTTKEILKENQSKNDIYLFCDEFNKLFNRTQRLESARNLIIKTIKQNENIANCDLFILMDLDDIGTYRINDNDILNAINFLFSEKNIAGVFANQLGGYYDMWSLRDKKYCDVDIWAEVFKLLMKNKNYSEQITRKHLEEAENEQCFGKF
jgi:glycosyltransferase involved in cell wall biosynthesis